MVYVEINSLDLFPDNWIYVHSPRALCGRILSLKNFSPFTVPDKNKTGLSLEYFCSERDELWNKSDDLLIKIALSDLETLNLAKKSCFIDGFVVRVPKTYPVYDKNYPENIRKLRNFFDNFSKS